MKKPEIKQKVNICTLSKIFLFIYIITLIPMLAISLYNWPSSDDFSMALQPHQAWTSSGSILAVLQAAVSKTIYLYNNWIGYYFSAFLTTLSPSIYMESLSALTPWIVILMLTAGTFYFFDAFMGELLGIKKDYIRITTFIALFLIIQCMNHNLRVEAFYWYSGAINYMFMFGLALFYVGILIRMLCCDSGYGRLIVATVLGFLLGGCNYMTALSLAIISVLAFIIFVLIKARIIAIPDEGMNEVRIKCLLIPAATNIIGFIISTLAPGNKIRGAEGAKLGAFEAILQSFEKILTVCVNEYLRWDVIALLLLLTIVFWHMASNLKYQFKHPFVFVLFSFCIVSANVTPPLYATGNIDAPRIGSIMWAQFIVFAIINCLYITCWIRQRLAPATELNELKSFTLNGSRAIAAILVVTLIVSTMFIAVNPHYYSWSSASYDLIRGNAQIYRAENQERLEILLDNGDDSVVLEEYSEKPALLYHEDIYVDENEWLNTAVARYYNKKNVSLKTR